MSTGARNSGDTMQKTVGPPFVRVLGKPFGDVVKLVKKLGITRARMEFIAGDGGQRFI